MKSNRGFYAFRRVQRLLILAFLVALFGCDSNGGNSNGDDGPDPAVDGLWQQRGEDVIFLDINTDARVIDVYDYLGDDFDDIADCYLLSSIDILDVDGEMYTLRGEGEVRFEVDGDVLTTTLVDLSGDPVSIVIYERSSRDITEFVPECDFSGDDSALGRLYKG